MIKNSSVNNEKIKIYSIDKSKYEIIVLDKSNNITTQIFLEYYNNFIPI